MEESSATKHHLRRFQSMACHARPSTNTHIKNLALEGNREADWLEVRGYASKSQTSIWIHLSQCKGRRADWQDKTKTKQCAEEQSSPKADMNPPLAFKPLSATSQPLLEVWADWDTQYTCCKSSVTFRLLSSWNCSHLISLSSCASTAERIMVIINIV